MNVLHTKAINRESNVPFHIICVALLNRDGFMLVCRKLGSWVLFWIYLSWNTTQSDEEALRFFERRVLRTIYGPTKEGDEYRNRHNQELYDLLHKPDIATVLRVNRLRWTGHIQRRPDEASVLRVTKAYFVDGKRTRVGPKNSWIGCGDRDARVLRTSNL